MSKKIQNIHIEPVVYLKNTNGDYVLDTDGEKIIVKQGVAVVPSDDYEILKTVTDY